MGFASKPLHVNYVGGVPAAVDFVISDGGYPICVNSTNGDLYVLVNNVITKIAGGRVVKVKPSDTSRASNNTPSNDPDLLFPIAKSETWVGRVFLDLTAAIHTTGVKVTIAAPSGASGNIHALITTDGQSAQESAILDTNTLGATLDFTAATFAATANNGFMEIIFRVVNGTTAGNVSLQWSQSTSSITALVLGAGSQLTADRTST